AIWSRQGEMAVMPARRQPSTASTKPHCWRVVARLREMALPLIAFLPWCGSRRISCRHPIHCKNRLHPRRRQFRICQHPRLVGEAEEFGQVLDRAGRLLAADHLEMVLEAIEIGEE